VLQVNYRGSTGYGKKFWEASFKQWGLAMQDDLADGVQWLIEKGIANKDRIAIFGTSYGGYATLAGLAFSDLYCCGIDYVGISNLFTFRDSLPASWEQEQDMYDEQIGSRIHDKEQLEATSPALHADKITAPLLIAQGAQDPRVNVNESNQMVEALQKQGVEVQYIVKENEGHGFYNEENAIEFYEAVEAFLARHL
jgi:dipeptidyl aminopeptidase/acylaminoacyl peptidase